MKPVGAIEIDIEPRRVAELHGAGEVQLIDVREDYEWDEGRIGGARHIDLGSLASEAESLDRDRPVVFYCHVGSRSAMAADAFRRAGYDAYTMVGGIERWETEGLPVADS